MSPISICVSASIAAWRCSKTDAEIEAFAAEMIDRFGPLPREVEQLLKIVAIKALCRKANVEKVEAGRKASPSPSATIPSPIRKALVRYVAEQGPEAKVRPDMRVVFIQDFEHPPERLEGTRTILRALAAMATKKAA